MNSVKRMFARSFGLALVLALAAAVGLAQQAGSLRGQVTDELGGALVGATVTVVSSAGAEKTAVTNDEGTFVVGGLAPGAYTVRVTSTGFAPYEAADVQVSAGRSEPLDIKLSITIEEEEVTVSTDRGISTESESNADALVLRGKDLDALPEDPDDMAAALNALAGPSVGPNGGQIYIDGFTGGRIPPKEAIREVRVSQNPLNAENDQPGFGRIDILTRPGFGKISGSASFGFQDESMNGRNPFAQRRADFQQRLVNLTLGGPIVEKKSSFFIDFQRREEDDNDIINAFVLDNSLNTVRVNDIIFQPRRFMTFSPRFDYALNENHTLVLRYSFSRTTLENAGVGNTFNLASRAFNTENTQHTFQITETAVINPKVINETRFQFIRDSNEQNDTNTLPAVIVNDSFTGGGAQVGLSFNRATRWELQNYSTATWLPNHTFRFGVRLRGVRLTDVSRNNFGGTFVFSSLDQYRDVLQGVAGALPSQFTIVGGEPEANVSQFDLGAFFQDEWRIRPNLTLTLGLRYENQTNISSRFNFAPRLFVAWAPGGTSTGTLGQFGAGQPKFVIRAGGGLFYNRFNESGTLGLNRFNGVDQLRFNISDQDLGANGQPVLESLLAGVVYNPDGTITNAPTIDSLVGLNQPQVVNRIDPNLEAP
ncbi:MAG TPA: carboxypeptidase regulatory-like domain-containing protein, partial [Pyrinomonadaceae bacterium]|nr:carboxypeptidase regulatory-like domain-containing protein [Pyrinomonadaceae bacterium]